ncbi:hypothetical protein JW921_01060 [Candidatus Fermentibacterales bacterium]|nr:hypothetical protein [Candidatus Fermentibacterales bacterium]
MENDGEGVAQGPAEPSPAGRGEISCTNCGAPVPYLEGESVLTCGYCGTTSMIAGFDKIVRVESHYVLPAQHNEDGARAKIFAWMKKGMFKARNLADTARWTGSDGLVLPFWVVKNTATTNWRGMNKKTRTVGSGKQQKREEYWEPASGQFTEEYSWPIYAREDEASLWGMEALKPGRPKVKADWGRFFLGFGMGSSSSGKTDLLEGREEFDLEKIRGMKILNGQIPQKRAEDLARNDVINLHADKAKSRATRITDCDTTVSVLGVDLVYVPLWEFEYQWEGSPYHVLVNGNTGDIIAGEAPVGPWSKVTMLSIYMAILAVLSALLVKDGGWIGSIVFAAIAVGYGLWTAFLRKR